MKCGVLSFVAFFLFGMLKWLGTNGTECGFSSLPIFGNQLYSNRLYFDFSAAYFGVGMLTPPENIVYMVIGGVVSWGIFWPYLSSKRGKWYNINEPDDNLHGLLGYQLYFYISIYLGDFLFCVCKATLQLLKDLRKKWLGNIDQNQQTENKISLTNRDLIIKIFTIIIHILAFIQKHLWPPCVFRLSHTSKDTINKKIIIIVHIITSTVQFLLIPNVFQALHWYHILLIKFLTPLVIILSYYFYGVSNWHFSSTVGPVSIFFLGSWCSYFFRGWQIVFPISAYLLGTIMFGTNFMTDFQIAKSSGITENMVLMCHICASIVGSVIGSYLVALWIGGVGVGTLSSNYESLYASINQAMDFLANDGPRVILLKHWLSFSCTLLLVSFFLRLIKEILEKKRSRWSKYVPLPFLLASTFIIGTYYLVDLCIGLGIICLWSYFNRAYATTLGPPVAWGMILGEQLWQLPALILRIKSINPPFCIPSQH